MSPGWLSQEKSDRLIDYLEERVFCPNFQTEYTCYLENCDPQKLWSRCPPGGQLRGSRPPLLFRQGISPG